MQIVNVTERGGIMIALISFASAILGIILGHFLHHYSVRSMEQRRIVDEFHEIKNSIYYTETNNYLLYELNKFRRFFIRHQEFLKIQENQDFFDNWLRNSIVERGEEVLITWSKEKFDKFYNDLERTKLK
jgi:hypothetical protein